MQLIINKSSLFFVPLQTNKKMYPNNNLSLLKGLTPVALLLHNRHPGAAGELFN